MDLNAKKKTRLFIYGGLVLGCLLLCSSAAVVYLYSAPGVYSNRALCFLHRFRTKALGFEGPFLELDHFEYFGSECSVRYKVFYRLKQSDVSFVNQIRKDYPNQEWGGVVGLDAGGNGSFKLSMRNTSKSIELTLNYGRPWTENPEFVVVVDELIPPAPGQP